MMLCPICKEELKKENKSFICKNNHCFDVAKQGYVNLSRKQKSSGDNKEMVQARTEFLENDYYDFMRQEVATIVKKIQPKSYLDIGCGQGYYTKVMEAKDKYGIDLSKEAIAHGARQDKSCQYIVGSIYDLPFQEESIDLITSIFTPIPKEEIQRVLRKDGVVIIVGPGPKHCWELKEQLYKNLYENPKPKTEWEGFHLEMQKEISQKSTVKDVWSLFEMTPYRYKSPKEGMDRIKKLKELEVTFDFVIRVWRKYGK